MKTALVVEPEAVTRGLLSELLLKRMGFSVVYTAGTNPEAQALFKEHRPQFILTEVLGAGFSGAQLLRNIELREHTYVLILSRVNNPALLGECISLGAQGFVSKDEDLCAFTQAVQVVCNGGGYFSPLHAQLLRQAIVGSYDKDNTLSPKEREILALIAQSHSNKTIAAKLDISIKTVENHRARLMRKLNLHDIAGLTRYAIASGLILPVV